MHLLWKISPFVKNSHPKPQASKAWCSEKLGFKFRYASSLSDPCAHDFGGGGIPTWKSRDTFQKFLLLMSIASPRHSCILTCCGHFPDAVGSDKNLEWVASLVWTEDKLWDRIFRFSWIISWDQIKGASNMLKYNYQTCSNPEVRLAQHIY